VTMLPEDLSRILSLESSRTFQRAWQYSESLIRSTNRALMLYFASTESIVDLHAYLLLAL